MQLWRNESPQRLLIVFHCFSLFVLMLLLAGMGDGKVGSGTHVVADGTAFGGKWKWMRQAKPEEFFQSPATGVDSSVLKAVGKASVTAPAGFKVHDRLVRGHVIPRLQSLGYQADGSAAASFSDNEKSLDWATAEALAFGSLLAEGKDVRLTGQDAQRGTFSHRHAVVVDQSTGKKVNMMNDHLPHAVPRPLNGASKLGKYHVYSSLLSEFGVLGFEHGYSLEDPNNLVLWEAQFGDFSNGAQIIIDQFIAGSESKWLRQSGLTMLLPHGYDGAGPEHSSARIERFLNLVNSQAVTRLRPSDFAKLSSQKDDKTAREALNMAVVNPTTPSNYFHALRRQMVREYRKPLVVIAPKTILRHPNAKSSLSELAPGTSFQPVLTEGAVVEGGSDKDVKRVLLVSGKLHLELQAKRNKDKHADTAIVRIEELAPFPTSTIMETISKRFPNTKKVDWVQEEPANAGAWTWAEAHLAPELSANGLPALGYIGRPALATPAVGLSKANKAQQDALLSWALP
jgi:probable 2-oxoglutarate dehydrogenase E1 component DHKTD1